MASLVFTLVGRDGLSPSLDSAARSAGHLDRQLDQTSHSGSTSIAQLVTDSDGRLRTLDGRFATAGEIAESGLGGGTERGSRRARAGLLSLLPSLSTLGSMGGSVLKVVAPVGKLLGLLGSAGPLLATLLTTLGNLLPAGGLAATGILMAVSAAVALKIGMAGVGAAVKTAFDSTATAADLQAALKGLAPPARDFVLTLRSMKPQFDGLKLSVQSALFAGLGTTVRDLGRSALPVLKTQLTGTATTLGLMARQVATTAQGLAENGTLGRALSGANKGLSNLSLIPSHVVGALVQIGAAAAPSFDRLTAAAGRGADALSTKLSGAFKSGAMQTAIDGAINLFGQLFHIIGNVGTILGNVLAQAGGGAGAFGFLGQLTDTLAKVSAMPGVQAAFGDLFAVMGEIGKVAAPLLGQAVMLLAPVLSALAPPALTLIDSLGAGLQPIITALGPVLLAAASAVGSLVTAALPLLSVAGQIVASLGPVLTPILSTVGGLFAALAPTIGVLGRSLLPPVAILTKTLGSAFQQLQPVLTSAVSQLGTQGLTPILTGLATILTQLVTQYSQQFLQMFSQLLPVVPVLIPVLVQLGKSVGQIALAIAPLLPQVMMMSAQFMTALLPAILPLLPPVAQLAVLLLRLATGVLTAVVIPSLGLVSRAISGMGGALHPVIGAVTAVTKGIASAFSWLFDILLGHSIIPDIVNGTVRWFAGLPGKAVGALAGLAGGIAGKASAAGSALITAVRRGIDGAVTVVRGMAGKAKSALGSVGTLLASAGHDLVAGFVNGILDKIPSVSSAASKIADAVPSTVKSLLSIFSPSKVMQRLGGDTGQGLIVGLMGTRSQISAMAAKISKDITDAFKGKKTTTDNKLLALVSADNQKLQSLAVQRDAIMNRIAAAKQFKSDTTSAALGTATLSSLGLGGEGAPVTAGTILSGLQDKLARIKQFTGFVNDLAKKGLAKGLLQQIIQMGPDAGFEYASALDGASKKQLASINSTAGQLVKNSTKLGTIGADALYDSGANAGKGFLAGLTSQEKAIENQMLKIAKGMQSAIRKALGINSPSTVLAKDGGYAVQGIEVGAVGRLPMLRQAMARVAATVASTDLAFSAAQANGLGVARTAAPAPVTIIIQGAIDPVATAKQLQKILLNLKRTSGIAIDLGVL